MREFGDLLLWMGSKVAEVFVSLRPVTQVDETGKIIRKTPSQHKPGVIFDDDFGGAKELLEKKRRNP